MDKNDIHETNPSEIKGSAVGESEKNVLNMFRLAEGKVLFIDEAYLFLDNSPFSSDMINALTAHIQPNPLFRPVIILAGYEDRMEEFFLKSNPGLRRRLAVNPPFKFNDFSEGEISIILRRYVADKSDFTISRAVVEHAVNILEAEKAKPNFGNAGTVENLVARALGVAGNRKSKALQVTDFGTFRGVEVSFKLLRQYGDLMNWYSRKIDQIRRNKERGLTPKKEMLNFLFLGRPGTGGCCSLCCIMHTLTLYYHIK